MKHLAFIAPVQILTKSIRRSRGYDGWPFSFIQEKKQVMCLSLFAVKFGWKISQYLLDSTRIPMWVFLAIWRIIMI